MKGVCLQRYLTMKSNHTPKSLAGAVPGFFVSLFGILGWLFQSILHLFTCGLILCGLIGLLIYAKVRPELDHCREVAYDKLAQMQRQDFSMLSDTEIYDKNDQLIGLINAGHYEYVPISQISMNLQNAYIAQEDRRFKSHTGVDWIATFRAGLALIKNRGEITQGGSTITQQVVKNTYLTQEQSFTRKIVEILLAPEIEKKYSKADIMEFYCNTNFYGNHCYGVEAASRYYFGKDASDLESYEAAVLVGISNSPTAYNPVRNPEASLEKRNDVLHSMLEVGYLTEDAYNSAISQPLNIVQEEGEGSNENYMSSYAIHCAALALMKLDNFQFQYIFKDKSDYDSYMENYQATYTEKADDIRAGGYRIYTTCEERVQEILEDYYSSPDNFPPVNNEEYPQSAFVITDTNGALKGIVGGNRGKEGNRIWNRASDTTRQIGSTIKPITSYVLGIEKDLITYSTVIEDRQVVINPDEVSYSQPLWVPKNEYNSFKGFVTVRTALIRSINTVAVQITQKLGTTTSYDFLKYSLNVDTLTAADDSYSPMALGSLSKGMTLVKLAGAYQMFGNGGVRTEPYSYTRVEDTYGNVILEKNTVPVRVISAETATVMNRLLQEVTRWEGTGAAANLGGMNIPVAGKTGTTDDSVDQWFVGVTPYYVGVCWLGYDSRYKTDEAGNIQYNKYGVAIPNSIRYSSYPPPKIWKAIMSQVHEGASGQSFETSFNIPLGVSQCTSAAYLKS